MAYPRSIRSTRQSQIDLRNPSGDDLHPLAPFVVLAAMLHPRDERARSRIMAMGEAETVVGPAKRPLLTLESAMRAARYVSPKYEVLTGAEWHDAKSLNALPMGSRRQILRAAFREFEPVAHLWGAQILADAEARDKGMGDEAPVGCATNEQLPRFLAVAEEIGQLGSHVWLAARPKKRRAWDPNDCVRFRLPDSAVEEGTLSVPRLHGDVLHGIRRQR